MRMRYCHAYAVPCCLQVYFAAESEADRREHHFEAEVGPWAHVPAEPWPQPPGP